MNFQRQTRGGIVTNRVKVEIASAYMVCKVTMMQFDASFQEPQLQHAFLALTCFHGL